MGKVVNVGQLKKMLENVRDDCTVVISYWDGSREEFAHMELTSVGILDGAKNFEEHDALSLMSGLSFDVRNVDCIKETLYVDERCNRDDVAYIDDMQYSEALKSRKE